MFYFVFWLWKNLQAENREEEVKYFEGRLMIKTYYINEVFVHAIFEVLRASKVRYGTEYCQKWIFWARISNMLWYQDSTSTSSNLQRLLTFCVTATRSFATSYLIVRSSYQKLKQTYVLYPVWKFDVIEWPLNNSGRFDLPTTWN